MLLQHQFLIHLRDGYLKTLTTYEEGTPFAFHQWDFTRGSGKVAVHVLRGRVFEKACVSEIMATVVIPGRDYESTIQWLGIQTFPASPLVPMLMAVFENVQEQGVEHCPCYFDIFPVIQFDEDRLLLEKEIGAACRKHNRTYPNLPFGYLKMFRLKEPGVGVGYAAGVALEPEEDNQNLFEDIALAAHRSYFELVDRRAPLEVTTVQKQEMHAFRARWVDFIYRENRFFKGGIELGVPVESFMLHMLPPTVCF